MDNTVLTKSQTLTLENRERLTVSAVEEVESFSENEITIKTALGVLSVKGCGLKIEDLSIENGTIILSGKIIGMEYAEVREKKSFFGSLFK